MHMPLFLPADIFRLYIANVLVVQVHLVCYICCKMSPCLFTTSTIITFSSECRTKHKICIPFEQATSTPYAPLRLHQFMTMRYPPNVFFVHLYMQSIRAPYLNPGAVATLVRTA